MDDGADKVFEGGDVQQMELADSLHVLSALQNII